MSSGLDELFAAVSRQAPGATLRSSVADSDHAPGSLPLKLDSLERDVRKVQQALSSSETEQARVGDVRYHEMCACCA